MGNTFLFIPGIKPATVIIATILSLSATIDIEYLDIILNIFNIKVNIVKTLNHIWL